MVYETLAVVFCKSLYSDCIANVSLIQIILRLDDNKGKHETLNFCEIPGRRFRGDKKI